MPVPSSSISVINMFSPASRAVANVILMTLAFASNELLIAPRTRSRGLEKSVAISTNSWAASTEGVNVSVSIRVYSEMPHGRADMPTGVATRLAFLP
jgi:hypothetical protein